jgi:hypothetical protein
VPGQSFAPETDTQVGQSRHAFSADIGCSGNFAHHCRNLIGFLPQRIKIISKELDR